ncbi:MAG: Spy/CpxP family protein refolding chaperone [Gemmatimonadales bacterium]
MSKVRTMALGALLVAGVAGVSAAQSTATPRPRSDSGSYHRGHRAGGEMRRGGGREFGDLNLSDAQKAQMKVIRDKYKPQNEALRAQAKPFMAAAKAARQKGDTVAFRTNMEKAHQVMQGGQSFRTQQAAEIRAILTPDQRVKFDARQKGMAERGAKGGHKGWSKKAAPQAKS